MVCLEDKRYFFKGFIYVRKELKSFLDVFCFKEIYCRYGVNLYPINKSINETCYLIVFGLMLNMQDLIPKW